MPETSAAPGTSDRVRRHLPPSWLPPAQVVTVADRGEFFVRRHVHPDPAAPTVVLLHGWTASSDLQFLGAYRELMEVCSFVGVDHRGHGRGLRSLATYELEDVADDVAAVLGELGLRGVIALGYSMGGPIAMHLCRRHPDLVAGLVVEGTAMEWRAKLSDRLKWKLLPLMGAALRSWAQPYVMRKAVERVMTDDLEFSAHRDWLIAELTRNDPKVMIEAGKALSRHDARPWAGDLGVPAGALITTRDRLVKPAKQRALAAALDAHVVEVSMDHLDALDVRVGFGAANAELVQHVAARLTAG